MVHSVLDVFDERRRGASGCSSSKRREVVLPGSRPCFGLLRNAQRVHRSAPYLYGFPSSPSLSLSLPNSRSPTPLTSPLSSPCSPVCALPPPHKTHINHTHAHTLYYTGRPQATTHPRVIGASSACSAPSGSTKCTAIPPSRKSKLSSSCATISTASMIRTSEGYEV